MEQLSRDIRERDLFLSYEVSNLERKQSAAMKRRHEQDIVIGLQSIRGFSFQFPIGVIDKNQDPWTTVLHVSESLLDIDCLVWGKYCL